LQRQRKSVLKLRKLRRLASQQKRPRPKPRDLKKRLQREYAKQKTKNKGRRQGLQQSWQPQKPNDWKRRLELPELKPNRNVLKLKKRSEHNKKPKLSVSKKSKRQRKLV